MNREEAIEMWVIPALKNTWNEKKCNEILKALEQEPCEELDFVQPHKKVPVNLEVCKMREATHEEREGVEPYIDSIADIAPSKWMAENLCDDCISRQEAIDAIWDGVNMDIYTSKVKECLEKLPPVTPAEKQEPCDDVCEWFGQYVDIVNDIVELRFSDGTVKRAKRGLYMRDIEKSIRKMLIDQMANEKKQEPCDDCISREAAICLADELKDDLPDDDRLSDMVMSHNEGVLEYQTKLSLLPSVYPKQRTGRWIDNFGLVYCSGCGATLAGEKNYCPDCGAKMQEVEE